jgi:hypothetical protein
MKIHEDAKAALKPMRQQISTAPTASPMSGYLRYSEAAAYFIIRRRNSIADATNPPTA